MVPRNTTAPVLAGAGIENPSRGTSTQESYPETITAAQWETAVLSVVNIAGEGGERGERARRAVHALCGGPFISRAVWTAAQGVAWVFIAAVLSGDSDLKARANALIKSVLALAAESRESLGRAA